jgi:hypothetical protein
MLLTVKAGESINSAAQVAQPGDTVLVSPGTYHERISPARGGTRNKPICYQVKTVGTVMVTGDDIRDRLFAPLIRGLGHIHIDGFVFEHCANRSARSFWEPDGTQGGAVSCRSGHHWRIENCTIRTNRSIGLDFGSEGGADQDGIEIPVEQVGHHWIRGNLFQDNGQCALCGHKSTGVKIVGNTIERSNCLAYNDVEEAGIKAHFFYNGLIEGNRLLDNDCHGIWLDGVWYGTKIRRNFVLNSVGAGIFVELGGGECVIDSNIIGYTRAGEGIYGHDTSGITVTRNLLYANAHYGLYMRTVSEREFPDGHYRAQTSANRIRGNIFVDNYRGQICLPLPNNRDRDNECDGNLFVGGSQWQWEGAEINRFCIGCDDGRIPRADIAKVCHENPMGIDEWRRVTGYDKASRAVDGAGQVTDGSTRRGYLRLGRTGFAVDNPATFAGFPGPFGEIKAGLNQIS